MQGFDESVSTEDPHWALRSVTHLPVRLVLTGFTALVLVQSYVLGRLEQFALRSTRLQAFLVRCHERAFRRLLQSIPPDEVRQVGVVGGGLFPRTVLVLQKIVPDCRLVVIDASSENIERARRYLRVHGIPTSAIEFVASRYDHRQCLDLDLVVIPLAFVGNRSSLYGGRPGPPLIVHDWLWHTRGDTGAVISYWLLKRINLILPKETKDADPSKRTLPPLLQATAPRSD